MPKRRERTVKKTYQYHVPIVTSLGVLHISCLIWRHFVAATAAATILVVVVVVVVIVQFNVHVSNFNSINMRQVSTESVNHCYMLNPLKSAKYSA